MFAVAALQLELAFLPQSRGALIGLVLSALVFLLLAPSRGWALGRALVLAGLVAVTVAPVLDVYSAATHGRSVATALDHALVGLGITAAAALVLGLVLGWLESRRPELVAPATARRLLLPASIAGAVALAVAAALLAGPVSREVSHRWSEFKAGEVSSESGSRFTSTSDPERYDYWRVAVDSAGEAPLVGIGAGNFQDAYTIHRHEVKPSRYAHDIWLEVLANTGVIGLLLFVSSLAVAAVTVLRARSSMSFAAQLAAAGALSATAYVLLHASVDWVDQFPPILGPALGLLMMAARLSNPTEAGPSHRQSTWLLTGIVLAGIALVALVPAYLAVRFVERAGDEWVTQPSSAYDDLDRAAYLNPLSAKPYLLAGEIAIARREDARARRSFERALEREDGWYPHFELGAIASKEGHPRLALAQMKTAKRLNPLEPLVEDSLAELEEGENLDPTAIQEQIRQQLSERFFNLQRERR